MRSRVRLQWLVAPALFAAGCGGGSPATSKPVTFNKDVAPIVFANCATCHRPGEAAPFSLLTYADAAKHAVAIADETTKRHMPPWLPERGAAAFIGERHLTDAQIDTIARWAKSGAVEGDPADLPKAPTFPEGWQLGRPDEVLTPEKPFRVTPGAEDTFRNLVLRRTSKRDVYVRAVEFRTGGAPIHHAVIRVDSTSSSRKRDGEDGQPGFEGMSSDSAQDPEGHFVGWAPGSGPIVSPDGMPWKLDAGADVVVEVHVMPTGTPVSIQPTVALYFSDTPPVRTPVRIRMGSKVIDIAAGDRQYVVNDTYELPVSADLLSVYPHAHYLGHDMLVTARLPNGTSQQLIHIPQWSFHWQQAYRYVTPIALPAGTVLTLRYTYDNSDENEDNPHHPPVRVRSGPRSTDEMAEFGLQLLPQTPEDARRLALSFYERDKLANVAMAEARVREAPNVAAHQAFLGGSYVEVGRMADAIPHLEDAIRLKDESAATYNYLGMALMAQGQVREALPRFERAARIDSHNDLIQFNLGNALAALSRPADAKAAYERALAINPDQPDAHVNLGSLLLSERRTNDALPHFARAAELQPDSAIIQNNYGGALAAAGRYQEAMQHVRRALQLRPDYAPALDNLRKLQQLGIK